MTTVSSEQFKNAMLADALCRVAGKSMMIYAGAEAPEIILQQHMEELQFAAIMGWVHGREFLTGEAV